MPAKFCRYRRTTFPLVVRLHPTYTSYILRFRIVWRAAPAVFKLLEESQRAGRNVMPQNGETNQEFGLCKTLCCGNEIIVREGGLFPDCPNHLGLTTIWKAIVDDSRRGNRS